MDGLENALSAAVHFRFGYLAQIMSLLTLALVNIALPNWLGVQAFARLNEAYAFVGFTSLVLTEGVSLLVIRRIADLGGDHARGRDVALQAAFEYALLVLPAVFAAALLTSWLAPAHHYAVNDWVLVALSALTVALYVPCVAWLTGSLRNWLVAIVSLVQGLLSFALPVALYRWGGDVRWAIAGSHVIGLGICFVAMWSAGGRPAWPRLVRDRIVCLRPELVAGVGPTAMRIVLTWLPVIVLTARQDLGAATSYKIGLSLTLGVLALVPFHKQTMLSLEGHGAPTHTMQLAAAAVLVATGGAVLLIGLAEPLTSLLYRPDFAALAQFLPGFALFVVLQVITDVLTVRLMWAHADRTLLAACMLAAVAAIAAMQASPLRWVPALTVATFIVAALALRREILLIAGLALRAGAIGVGACVVAVLLGRGLGLAVALLIVGLALMVHRPLYAALGQLTR
jgi:O-antigen/teichoic acid export membrane protein